MIVSLLFPDDEVKLAVYKPVEDLRASGGWLSQHFYKMGTW
jgi:hypothetical protein